MISLRLPWWGKPVAALVALVAGVSLVELVVGCVPAPPEGCMRSLSLRETLRSFRHTSAALGEGRALLRSQKGDLHELSRPLRSPYRWRLRLAAFPLVRSLGHLVPRLQEVHEAAQRAAPDGPAVPQLHVYRRLLIVATLFLALCAPLSAQTPSPPSPSSLPESAGEAPAGEEPEPESEEPESVSPVTAAAWCTVRSSRPEGEEEEPAAESAARDLGCDVGVGLALYRWRRLSWVAVLGAKSLGSGVAFVPYRGRGPVIAIALGFVFPYDSSGIYSGEAALAVGATLSFARAGK